MERSFNFFKQLLSDFDRLRLRKYYVDRINGVIFDRKYIKIGKTAKTIKIYRKFSLMKQKKTVKCVGTVIKKTA